MAVTDKLDSRCEALRFRAKTNFPYSNEMNSFKKNEYLNILMHVFDSQTQYFKVCCFTILKYVYRMSNLLPQYRIFDLE